MSTKKALDSLVSVEVNLKLFLHGIAACVPRVIHDIKFIHIVVFLWCLTDHPISRIVALVCTGYTKNPLRWTLAD